MLVERSPTPEPTSAGLSSRRYSEPGSVPFICLINFREGLPVPMEPALAASGGRMPEADWSLRERPATRHGQPRAASRGDPGPPQRSPFCGP